MYRDIRSPALHNVIGVGEAYTLVIPVLNES
jgi:hypothetical protein